MRSILLATLVAITPACSPDITVGPVRRHRRRVKRRRAAGGTPAVATTVAASANTGKVAVTVDQGTVTTGLGKTVALTYTIASQNGYAGTVTVTPSVTTSTARSPTGHSRRPDRRSRSPPTAWRRWC